MNRFLSNLIRTRALRRLDQRKAEISSAIAYAQDQIRHHQIRIEDLLAERGRLAADQLTIELRARSSGSTLSRLGVPSSTVRGML